MLAAGEFSGSNQVHAKALVISHVMEKRGVALERDVVVLHLLHAPLVAVLETAARLFPTGILPRRQVKRSIVLLISGLTPLDLRPHFWRPRTWNYTGWGGVFRCRRPSLARKRYGCTVRTMELG